jgi:hypothetical protein
MKRWIVVECIVYAGELFLKRERVMFMKSFYFARDMTEIRYGRGGVFTLVLNFLNYCANLWRRGVCCCHKGCLPDLIF